MTINYNIQNICIPILWTFINVTCCLSVFFIYEHYSNTVSINLLGKAIFGLVITILSIGLSFYKKTVDIVFYLLIIIHLIYLVLSFI